MSIRHDMGRHGHFCGQAEGVGGLVVELHFKVRNATMPKDFPALKNCLPGAWHMRFVDAVAWAQRHPNQDSARLHCLHLEFVSHLSCSFLFHMQSESK